MDAAADLIERIPDEVARELFHKERRALSAALAECPGSEDTHDELADAVGLVDLRLDALGVPR